MGKLKQHEFDLSREDRQSELYRFKVQLTKVKYSEEGRTKNRSHEVLKGGMTRKEAVAFHAEQAKKYDEELHSGKVTLSMIRDYANEKELAEYRDSRRDGGNEALGKRIAELEKKLSVSGDTEAAKQRIAELEEHVKRQDAKIRAMHETGPTAEAQAQKAREESAPVEAEATEVE